MTGFVVVDWLDNKDNRNGDGDGDRSIDHRSSFRVSLSDSQYGRKGESGSGNGWGIACTLLINVRWGVNPTRPQCCFKFRLS